MKLRASSEHLSSKVALWHLGFRQTIRGAIIIGLLVGFMASVQGLAFGSTYPDEKSRTAFATTIESAPALGILYGETKDLDSAAGYMVYRTVPIMTLIVSIWAIMTISKLLRGQEEDSRWEIISAGSTTPRRASMLLSLGFAASLIVAFLIATIMISIAGSFPDLDASFFMCLLLTLAIFTPGLLFASLGVFTSQLAVTRRRAMMYSLVPLALLFGLRSLANTVPDLYWLKSITPFGWSDMISPVFDPQARWLFTILLTVPIFACLGVYLAGKRDLGAGFITESTKSRSRFYLLDSALGLALRRNLALFLGWSIAALTISLLMASIMGIAAEAVADSPSLGTFIGQLGGSMTDIKIAFLGAGLVFVAITLLIMAAACMGGVRKDEAKSYLDTLFAQPVRRSSWLAGRLMQILLAFMFISITCVLATWLVAELQNISLDLWNMFLISIALNGTVIFLLGFGALLYGTFPRLAVIGMYVIITWSFLIDVIGSVVELNDVMARSSLLHYISFSPAETPDWGTFTILTLLGASMAAIGVFAFTKRDIVTE